MSDDAFFHEVTKAMGYHLGKIVEGAMHHQTEYDSPGLGRGNPNLIEDRFGQLVAYLQGHPKASEFRYLFDSLHEDTRLVKHAIAQLYAFFDNSEPSEDERNSAEIFALFLNAETLKIFRSYENDLKD